MRKEDPSPSMADSKSAIFYLGRDRRGRWIAQDEQHLRGGMFISEAAAHKFALDENGHRPEAIVPLAEMIELDFDSAPLHDELEGRRFRKAA